MIDDEIDLFGPNPPIVGGDVIPFPKLRANATLAETWRKAVEQRNKKQGTAYAFPAAADPVDEVIQLRGMPTFAWPAQWPGTARRCKVYPKDMVGVVGSQGGGKTSFALQACIAATGDGTPVLWAPLELGNAAVLTRGIGNIHSVHASTVRDTWSREKIAHAAATFTDNFHFIDRIRDPDKQLTAMRTAVEIAWEVYRRPPVLVVDHIGKLFADSRDLRVGATHALNVLHDLTEELNCITFALSQGSRGNQAVLTGKTQVDAAADAMGVAAEARAFEEDCAYVIALALFKADDVMRLDAHALFTKCRHTGLEGREGFRFGKPGGVWDELDYLPATPAQEKAAIESDKRDKTRVAPPRSPREARADVNAQAAGDAATQRRSRILAVVRNYGMLGIELNDLRKSPGVGRGAMFSSAVQELERTGSLERYGSKVRITGRTE